MDLDLTPQQQERQAAYRDFVTREIMPQAEAYDETGRFPDALVGKMAAAGYLGALAPAEYSGLALDELSFGLLCEQLGRGCASARSLLTVHSMAVTVLFRWGSPEHKARWGERLATGQAIAAFALSEPQAGSDARAITTTATPAADNGYYLNGGKKWITFGQTADLFLLIAKSANDQLTAFWLERDTPGLTITPIDPLGGCRASMLAELHLDNCPVGREQMIGRPGMGWSMVGSTALNNGRYSVAWGCVGLAQACLEAALDYAGRRQQFGSPLGDHQLIQKLLTDMATTVEAARLLALRAGHLRQKGAPGSILATSMAKYYAATAASQVSADAVQIHGANGFSRSYPVHRHWRDAKVMEIIEGSNQIQQMIIARELLNH